MVSHCEALGNEQLLTCQLDDGAHLVQLRAAPQEQLPPGSTVHLDIDPQGWRLFDASGNALPVPQSQEPVLPRL